jgi:electron transfer flavoprotein beta subunit
MKELLAAGKKPVERLDLKARTAAVTVTARSRPERRARQGRLIDAADPAAAAAELAKALREAGAL